MRCKYFKYRHIPNDWTRPIISPMKTSKTSDGRDMSKFLLTFQIRGHDPSQPSLTRSRTSRWRSSVKNTRLQETLMRFSVEIWAKSDEFHLGIVLFKVWRFERIPLLVPNKKKITKYFISSQLFFSFLFFFVFVELSANLAAFLKEN